MKHNGWRKPTPGLLVAEKHAQAGEQLSLRRLVRRMAVLGLIWIKDSPNGKRYGHRDANGVIVEAYGFDLAPLAARAEEFEALYARLKEERQYCASLRNVITVTRRMIRAKIEKALESGLRGPWHQLEQEFAALLKGLPKRTTTSNKLMDIVDWFKDFKDRVEQAFEAAFDWPKESDQKSPSTDGEDISNVVSTDMNMTPTGASDGTHILTTKQPDPVNSNCFENKAAAGVEPERPKPGRVERPEDLDLDIEWSTHTNKRKSDIDIPMLMLTCPHFAEMARGFEGNISNWDGLHRAAGKIRGMAGISENAWNVSQRALGPAAASAAIALIFDKHSTGEVTSPGGYLRGMVEKARAGELHLDRSFYGRLSERGAAH
jgi:replication initiation protein RepC